jgi:hypothetical protein
MNSQILVKINSFIKNRLFELSGILLIIISVFLLVSIVTYSGGQGNFIYKAENSEIDYANFGGFYGSALADFLLQSIGLIVFLVVLNLFVWGFKLITEKGISNFISKIFFTIVYIIFGTTFINIFNNNSFWLIDNGNSGFIGRIVKENLYAFTTLIENQYVVYSLILLTIVFFILSLNIKLNEIIKIFLSPFIIIKIITNFREKSKVVDILYPIFTLTIKFLLNHLQ